MSGPFWRGVTQHLGLKIGALAVAILLWLIVAGAPDVVTLQPAPILYQNLRSGLVLSSDAPANLQVELRGAAGKLTQSLLSSVFVKLDLSEVAGPGEQTLTLSGGEFSLPHGVSFLRAVPSQVRLRIFRVATKEAPVRVRLDGSPPAGYRITRADPVPGVLRVSGPEPRVQSVLTADTDPIDVRNLTRDTVVRTNAFVDDARVQFESPPVVRVKLTIEKTEDGR